MIGVCLHMTVLAAGTVYVSSSGSAENSGASDSEPTTLEKAYSLINSVDTIILMDDITYSEAPAHSSALTIKGKTSGVVLTTPVNVSINGDTTFSNLTLSGGVDVFANGHKLTVEKTVTSQNAVNVFGGCNGKTYTGDTNLTILGGRYTYILGGSNKATVKGSSNVTVGGNATVTRIYGGGYNSTVTESTNITFGDNATCEYIFGTNRLGTSGIAAPKKAVVNMTGGTVKESIYGGTSRYEIANCNIYIKMTGGKTESIFGGSNTANVTGNVCIDVFGGEVTRRIYTGCYNDYTGEWESSNYVKGSTILRLKKGAKLVTGYDGNRGIFLGSRIGSDPKDEINTVIYLDDCYSTYSGKIGEQGALFTNLFKSYADYTVKAGTGGDVRGTDVQGVVYVQAQDGSYAELNGNTRYESGDIQLPAGTNVIEFKQYNFKIHALKAYTAPGKIISTVTLSAQNNGDIKFSSPVAIVAVFDKSGRLVTAAANSDIGGYNSYTFVLDNESGAETEYKVKAMIFNEDNLCPLTEAYTVNTTDIDDGYEPWNGADSGTLLVKLDYNKDLIRMLR